jgi:hypothetical protein
LNKENHGSTKKWDRIDGWWNVIAPSEDYSDASSLVGTAKSNSKTKNKNLREGKNLSLDGSGVVFPKSA